MMYPKKVAAKTFNVPEESDSSLPKIRRVGETLPWQNQQHVLPWSDGRAPPRLKISVLMTEDTPKTYD